MLQLLIIGSTTVALPNIEKERCRNQFIIMLNRIFRVLYVVNLNPSHKYGSLEEQIFLTSAAVSQQEGLLLPVFSGELPNKENNRYRDAGLTATSLNLGQFTLSTLRRLLHLIDHHRIDVVHWNLYHPMNGYVSSLRLLRPRLRHYLTDHNSRPQSFTSSQSSLMGAYKKVMLGGYSKVLGVSDYILSELKKQAIWNNPGRYYHFVNTERFQPDERVRLATRTSQGFHGSFVILVVAHLIPEKGVDVAIRALKELPDRVVLWVIGDGPERLALQRAAESLGVHKRTLFVVYRLMSALSCKQLTVWCVLRYGKKRRASSSLKLWLAACP